MEQDNIVVYFKDHYCRNVNDFFLLDVNDDKETCFLKVQFITCMAINHQAIPLRIAK